jgi:biopolymer transport protein ExbD
MDAGPAPEISSAVPFEANALAPRKPMGDDARFDITAMVDLVFMMNIYFLVTWVGSAMSEMNLPVARHCTGAGQNDSLIISVMKGSKIYLGEPLPENLLANSEVEKRIERAVDDAVLEQKKFVLVKGEYDAALRDIVRVAGVATASKGLKLMVAVMQKDVE